MRLTAGRLTVRPGFVTLICCCIYFGSGKLLLVFLLAAALHEAGHLLAVWVLGLHVRSLTLSALGAELRLEEETATSFLQDLILCCSGPAANLCAAAVCGALDRFPLFLGANLLLGCFNLLPVLPLDGGGALYALTAQLVGWERSEWAAKWFSRLFSLAVAACGLAVLSLEGGKPWLLLLGAWLTAASFFPRGK